MTDKPDPLEELRKIEFSHESWVSGYDPDHCRGCRDQNRRDAAIAALAPIAERKP